MGQVIWSPSALQDIDDIAAYISKDSPDRAALFVSRLIEATDKLELHPQAGHMIPEMNESSSRELSVWPYRIMYRLEENGVWITGVIHGARKLGA